MRTIRNKLTYANVVATVALAIAVAGGTAYAANSVFSSDIVNGEVKTADIGTDEVRSVDVRNDSLAGGGLTGRDIQDRSGVDTCPDGSNRFGELCVRVSNLAIIWAQAVRFCGDLELHVPTLGEAVSLARNHDIPGVDNGESLWTDEFYSSDQNRAIAVKAGGDDLDRPAHRLHYSGDRLRDDADELRHTLRPSVALRRSARRDT